MTKVDFHEYYSATVDCPVCDQLIELEVSEVPYCEDEEVECKNCGCKFQLGEPI